MITSTYDVSTNEVLVRGDFFDFERVSHVMDQITGSFGVPADKPLPEYRTALSILLPLSVMIRRAEDGRCELYTMPSGINDRWLAPAGTPADKIMYRRPIKEEDPVIDEVDRAIIRDGSVMLDRFYEKDEEEQSAWLRKLGFSTGKISRFLKAAKPLELYCFPCEKYPHASFYNTQLQFRLRLSEAALYAFILREILGRKENLLKNMAAKADALPADVREYQMSYILLDARSDLLLLELVMEQLFGCLCGLPGEKTCSEKEAPSSAHTPCRAESRPDDLSPDSLLSFANACSALRFKEAPEKFLKDWGGKELNSVAELLKSNRETGPDGIEAFIDRLLSL